MRSLVIKYRLLFASCAAVFGPLHVHEQIVSLPPPPYPPHSLAGLLAKMDGGFGRIGVHIGGMTSQPCCFHHVPADGGRFEFWESNVAGRLGLGVALRYAMEIGMRPIESRIRQLAGSLRKRLDAEPGVSLTDLGRVENQCGIVSFGVAGMDPGDVKQALRSERVYVSTSAAGSTPLDAADRGLPTVVSETCHGTTCLVRLCASHISARS